MSARIAYCKIFPPVGIARVGNSSERDGFFIGPEGLESRASPHYKDAHGAVLRQAARFRVYGFDSSHHVVREITSREAEITWHASLANRKAEWFAFSGGRHALEQFEKPGGISWEKRNKSIKDPKERDRRLAIDPRRPVSIKGNCQAGDAADPEKYAFVGKFQDTVSVYLGELRTDEVGRLLMLGGRGHSAAIDETGKDISSKRWILHYANNDDWHDDTSDGPVSCSVEIGGRSLPVKGRAWVIVTPPDFAPAVENIVTLFDVMEHAALTYHLKHPGLPSPSPTTAVEFWEDI
jgi:hypothetical protein